MSRGLGRVERHVLEQLQRASHGLTVTLLMQQSPGLTEPSLRRAIASLRRKGLIAPAANTGEGHRIWWLHVEAAKAREKRQRQDDEKLRTRQEKEDAKAEWRYAEFMARRGLAVEQPPDLDMIAAMLGMLGSDHDGECLAAARKAEATRRKSGRTWRQLFSLDR